MMSTLSIYFLIWALNEKTCIWGSCPGNTHISLQGCIHRVLNFSKTCLKWPLKIDKTKVLMENGSLMKVKSIAECILQYFWSALCDNWYWKPIFGVLFEWSPKTGFTVDYWNVESSKLRYYYCQQGWESSGLIRISWLSSGIWFI